jgi:hypothetical protein
LGHVGHVTYNFINMLFISTVIFDDNQYISTAETEGLLVVVDDMGWLEFSLTCGNACMTA